MLFQNNTSYAILRSIVPGLFRTVVLLLTLAILPDATAQPIRTQVGINGLTGSAGLHLNDDWYNYFTYPIAQGGGIVFRQKIRKNMQITAGISAVRWNATFTQPNHSFGEVTIFHKHQSVYFPITYNWYLGTTNRIYLIAGAAGSVTQTNQLTRKVKSRIDQQVTIEDITATMNLRKTDLYMLTGLGFNIPLGKGWAFYAEPHYLFNLPNQSREWLHFDPRNAFFDNRQINIQAGIQKTLRS